MVVHVGVVGHRPNRLGANINEFLIDHCQQLLRVIQQALAPAHDPLVHLQGAPLLRVISALAEGADRIVAQAGLNLGADLQCLLPFHVEEYSKDFESPSSRDEFLTLLGKSSAVLELDGQRADAPAAYELAGRALLAQSDMLIAIWDGGPRSWPRRHRSNHQ